MITVISGRKLIKHEVVTATDEIIRFPVEDIANTEGMADSKFIKGTVQHTLGLIILLDFTEIGKNQEDFR